MKTRMRTRRKGRTARVKSEEEGDRGLRRRLILDQGSNSSRSSPESEGKLVETASGGGGEPPSNKSIPAAKDISLLNLEDFTPPSV